MTIDNMVMQGVASVWNLVVALARGQPLGALIILILLADGVLSVAGALLDRWEAAARRRPVIPPCAPASRSDATPPACGAAAGR